MEVWEAASALGVATIEVEEWHEERARLEAEWRRESDPSGGDGPRVKSGQDILAQRVAAARGEGPPPEVPVMHQIQMQGIMRSLRGD
jgi:hypothetical protein